MKNLFYPMNLAGRISFPLLVLRVVAGAAFMFHGWGKIQNPFSWMGPDAPIPGFLLFLAAVSEFFGGLAWIIGLLTPLASFGILCTMSVAVMTHLQKGDPFVGMGGAYEPAAVYFCIAFLLASIGAGKYSLDAKLFGKDS